MQTGELYEDKAGEWRWRVKAENGEITAASEEGFKSFEYAAADAERENPDVPFAPVDPDFDPGPAPG